MHTIEDQLTMHEGLRLKPYRCTANKLTIGIGRNLEDKGLSEDEALFLLANDIAEVSKRLERFEWFNSLDQVRRKVLIDMAFNLGIAGLLRFKKMIAALEAQDYNKAYIEMVNSNWYKQVRTRAVRLAEMMRTGEDYKE